MGLYRNSRISHSRIPPLPPYPPLRFPPPPPSFPFPRLHHPPHLQPHTVRTSSLQLMSPFNQWVSHRGKGKNTIVTMNMKKSALKCLHLVIDTVQLIRNLLYQSLLPSFLSLHPSLSLPLFLSLFLFRRLHPPSTLYHSQTRNLLTVFTILVRVRHRHRPKQETVPSPRGEVSV